MKFGNKSWLLWIVISHLVVGIFPSVIASCDENSSAVAILEPNRIKSLFEVSEDWSVIGKWRIIQGDGLSYAQPTFNDTSWAVLGCKTVNHLCNEGGFFWYRAVIPVPTTWQGEKIILKMGWIADWADIYINGQLVARNVTAQYSARNLTNHTVTFPYRGRMPKTLLDISHTYEITDFLKFNEPNLLAIRLYTSTTSGGLGMMGIGTRSHLETPEYDIPLSPDCRILLLGDSITDQSGYVDSYPRKLWDFFNAFYPEKNLTIINFGRNAETTSRGVRRLSEIMPQNPDLVLINLGVNGVWWANINESQYRLNIEDIVQNLSLTTGARIVLSTITPLMFDEDGQVTQIFTTSTNRYLSVQGNYNRIIYSVAREYGLDVVPLYETFESILNITTYDGTKFAGYLLQRDGIHPNARGAATLARAILEHAFSLPLKHLEYLEEIWNYDQEAGSDDRSPSTTSRPPLRDDIWYTESVKIELDAEDPRPGSGVSAIFYSVDAEGYKKYYYPIDALEGEHNYSYFSVDNAGNVENVTWLSLNLDTKPPEISVSLDLQEVSPWQALRIIATVYDTRGIEQIICRYWRDDETEAELGMTPRGNDCYDCTLPGMADSIRVNYYIWARDQSGHECRTSTYSYTVPEGLITVLSVLHIFFMASLTHLRDPG